MFFTSFIFYFLFLIGTIFSVFKGNVLAIAGGVCTGSARCTDKLGVSRTWDCYLGYGETPTCIRGSVQSDCPGGLTDNCCMTSCPAYYCASHSSGCAQACDCKECGPQRVYSGGGSCGSYTDYYSCKGWTTGCTECETCSSQCGQAKNCGGNCNYAGGGPVAPTIVDPIGSVASPVLRIPPVTLSWTAAGGADYYTATIRNLSTGVTMWVDGLGALTTTVSLPFGYTYSWQVRGVNTECGTEVGTWSGLGYFMTDYVPTLDSITLKNSSGTIVVPDALLRNNICQKGFMYDPNPRRVNVELKIRDTDVAPDGVKNATLRWNGRLYPLTLTGPVANVWTSNIILDYPVSEGSVGPFNWELQASDIYVTSAWIDSGKAWKIWSCQVPVSGTVFDGSSGQACNTSGFTVAADNKLGFSSLIYKDMSASDDISMSTNPPATYGVTNVIYGKDYLPLFNGGSVGNPDGTIIGTGRFTRGIDLGTGTTICATFLGSQSQFNLENIISAYSANPSAQIDFSFIRDQESWFQVAGGGVKAKTDIDSGVPVTALPLASRALSILGTRAGNSLIAYGGNFRNINGYNDTSAFGKPNNWYVNGNANDLSNYSYQYFYNTFYINGGVGVTGTNWASHPSDGVYFVNGDLTIDNDFALAANKTLMVIVKGKITIENTVSRLDGIYIADGNNSDAVGIEANGNSDNQLIINGSLYSRKGIRLYRTFTTKRLNNTTPAVKVNYEANLLFNMPGTLMKVLSGWREE